MAHRSQFADPWLREVQDNFLVFSSGDLKNDHTTEMSRKVRRRRYSTKQHQFDFTHVVFEH